MMRITDTSVTEPGFSFEILVIFQVRALHICIPEITPNFHLSAFARNLSVYATNPSSSKKVIIRASAGKIGFLPNPGEGMLYHVLKIVSGYAS